MQYAEQQPTIPFTRTMLGPVVALVIGVAGATGAYALIDDDGASVQPSTRVIVADTPVQPGEGVGAKNEAGVAAAIGNPGVSPSTEMKDEAGTAAALANPGVSPSTEMKDEAGTAAAIANPGVSPSTEMKDEAGTAAAIGSSRQSGLSDQAEQDRRIDPHGPASSLR